MLRLNRAIGISFDRQNDDNTTVYSIRTIMDESLGRVFSSNTFHQKVYKNVSIASQYRLTRYAMTYFGNNTHVNDSVILSVEKYYRILDSHHAQRADYWGVDYSNKYNGGY
jgi:hypothetical protein